MTPAGMSNELDVQNGWEENTHTHTISSYCETCYIFILILVHCKTSNRCSWRRRRRSNHSVSVTRKGDCVCVCVVSPFILDVRLVDVPAGVTHEGGHTGFSSTFLLRCLRINRSPLAGHFLFFVRKNTSLCDSTGVQIHVPTSEGFEVTN